MSRSSRLMIIDDCEPDLVLLREAISESGWNAEISDAANRRQALHSLRRSAFMNTPPDLILTNYHISRETCIEMIREIRGNAVYQTTPIIVISTTMPPETNREQCYSLGVLKVLMKTFSYPALVKLVASLRKMLDGSGNISRGGSWISDSDLALLSDG
jgi:CheY-like chemotaxis protein